MSQCLWKNGRSAAHRSPTICGTQRNGTLRRCNPTPPPAPSGSSATVEKAPRRLWPPCIGVGCSRLVYPPRYTTTDGDGREALSEGICSSAGHCLKQVRSVKKRGQKFDDSNPSAPSHGTAGSMMVSAGVTLEICQIECEDAGNAVCSHGRHEPGVMRGLALALIGHH